MEPPLIVDSARKHGIADDDILHAFHHPVSYEDLDEGFTMIIGPSRSAQLLEIVSSTPITAPSSCTR
ncbi:MAG: hypothetical protein WD794_05825 [Mycobacteriales bacterium]